MAVDWDDIRGVKNGSETKARTLESMAKLGSLPLALGHP